MCDKILYISDLREEGEKLSISKIRDQGRGCYSIPTTAFQREEQEVLQAATW